MSGSELDTLYKLARDGKLPYPPRVTKYELAKIIAVRTRQLVEGAPPLVDPKELGTTDPVAIAMEEYRRGLLPFIIIRRLPNGRRVEYSLRELQDLEKQLMG